MKASELINFYQQGRRNFSRENLRGENFDGQKLSDINLSHADIRGASFVNANLTGAKFTYAQAGSTFGVSFFRTIFQLTVAFLAMRLSIFYCLSFNSASIRASTELRNSDTGGLVFLEPAVIGMSSLLFLIFSASWIYENWISILCCCFAPIVVVNVLGGSFINIPALIGIFLFMLMIIYPLIIWVSTAVHYIVESLPYQGTWIWQATTFRGAILQRADFYKATLGNTEFRFFKLEKTFFYQAKYLNVKLFKKTNLASKKLLRKSIITPKKTL